MSLSPASAKKLNDFPGRLEKKGQIIVSSSISYGPPEKEKLKAEKKNSDQEQDFCCWFSLFKPRERVEQELILTLLLFSACGIHYEPR